MRVATLIATAAAAALVVAQDSSSPVGDLLANIGADGSSGGFDVFVKLKNATFTALEDDESPWDDLFPNINMVGMSYDLLRGNPHPTSGGMDPGWRAELFEINYENEDTVFVGNQQYRIPDGVQVTSCPVCSLAMESSDVGTAEDYANSLHVNVKVKARRKGLLVKASFKASTDFRSVEQKSEQTNNFFMESTAECTFYCPRIRLFDAPQLSATFTNAVASLPVQYTESTRDVYEQFLDFYGTHVALGMAMGGTFGVRHEISESNLQTMRKLDVKVQASASFSAARFSGGGSALTDFEKQQAQEFSSRTESQTSFAFGGRPIENPDSPEDTSLWMDSVRADPLPVRYDLIELTELLNSNLFPDDSAIDAKRENLEDALVAYCTRLEAQGEIVCDFPGAQVTPEFGVVKVGPIGLGFPQSFNDFEQWLALGRPALTEIRGRQSNAIDVLQAVYGPYATDQHGGMGQANIDAPFAFVLDAGEHIVGVEVCYDHAFVYRMQFRTSRDRQSPIFGPADIAALNSSSKKTCRMYNFPSRLLYISGYVHSDTRMRNVAFHYANYEES